MTRLQACFGAFRESPLFIAALTATERYRSDSYVDRTVKLFQSPFHRGMDCYRGWLVTVALLQP